MASAPSVLVVGGSGVVGARALRALRQLQPDLPITIGARDLARAERLAREIGRSDALKIDLELPDLGLPPHRRFAAIAVLLKDEALRTLRYAQDTAAAYVSFSEFAFDIAPTVAAYVERPASVPILFLGQFLGGTVAAATLSFARELRTIHSIQIGAILDEDDSGGPAAQGDGDRVRNGVPHSLLRKEGRFIWAREQDAARTFVDGRGRSWQGSAYPLLDVASLAAATGAQSVRVDFAIRPRTSRAREEGPSTEVIVELEGTRDDGTSAQMRYELVDPDVHAGLSARGLALAIERMLGLRGGPAITAGLHQPETLLDPDYVVAHLRDNGTRIARLPAVRVL
jgi:hypothetical protein